MSTSKQVFAFARVDDAAIKPVYQSILEGKSRFGMWDQPASLKEKNYGRNRMLLDIREGDWIVHVNLPSYGHCVAVQATGQYQFDDGIIFSPARQDFNNYIPVDSNSRIEFNRNDINVLPSVNLSPLKRIQRIHNVADFEKSLDNIKNHKHTASKDLSRGVLYLREKVDAMLPEMTKAIHEMHKSKKLELFLDKIFTSMPNFVSKQNGSGWGTDHGADLIIEFRPIVGIKITTRLVVQVKSYEGNHNELEGVEQIVTGINKYDADGGILISTGNKTEQLESHVLKRSEEINKPIDIIAGLDVAKFVLRYAPEMLIGPM